MTFTSFKDHFLVAMPGLDDPNFHQSVTYICEHHEDGAMGIIINQPLKLTLKELFEHLDMNTQLENNEHLLFSGGPVHKERGFVLHSSERQWETTLPIGDGVSLTGSKDILEAIANNEGPEQYIIALGYAGWDAGQLEEEIAANSWLTVPADQQIIFETDYDKRWESAARKLGIDLHLIAQTPGHA